MWSLPVNGYNTNIFFSIRLTACFQQWWMESWSSPQDKNGSYRFDQEITEVRRKEKNKGWETKNKDGKRTEFLWIITCCGEAKLTLLGTSYAIWVETPPMSKTPAVLCLTGVSCRLLSGTCCSTTASSSSKIDQSEANYIVTNFWELIGK